LVWRPSARAEGRATRSFSRSSLRRFSAVLGFVALALPGAVVAAEKPNCPNIPLNERAADAPIAFVGQILGERPGPGTSTVYRFSVEKAIKGVEGTEIEVRAQPLVDAAGKELPRNTDLGVVALLSGATPVTDSCSISNPSFLIASIDEPRGNGIRLLIGALFLVLALVYAARRRARVVRERRAA
jgi:hypothetical protein